MEDLQNKIIELMDLFDGEVTTADKIPQPAPRQDVVEIDAVNEFIKRNPRADGGRIGFKVPGLVKGTTSKVKTDEFQYPVKFKNKKTGKIETVYKKEPIDYESRVKRVSTLVDTYETALDDFQKQVNDAIQSKDVSKLPRNFTQFLKDKELKPSTYQSLLNKDQLPKIETNTGQIRLNFANSLIKDANESLKFINAETLFKNAGFTSKEYKSLYATKQLFKLDQAIDKVDKAFNSLFSTKTNPKAVNLFNPVQKIAGLTGLDNSKISNRLARLDIKNKSPELHRAFRLFSNPNFKKNIATNFPDLTLNELLSTPETFFADYAQSKSKKLRGERVDKATKLAGESVADINAAQDELIATLNKFYKDNPQELLNNTKLRNLLDLTLEDGEIIKKNKYVTDEDFLKLIKEKTGLFTKDHVDEVQFEKLSTEFPIFKQLATYNTNSGLIKSIKSYVAKNQNSTDPVVQDKIKKQIAFLEDLKLRVDTPTGRVGSKEVLAAVDRQAGTLPNFLAQLKALNIKLPAKAKAVLLGTGGGLAATTLAAAGPIEETGSTAMDTAKTVGAGTTGALALGTKKGRNILGRTIGGAFGPTGVAGLTVAGGGYDLSSPLDRFILGTEAAFAPELVKGTIGATKGMKNRALQKVVQRALNLGMSVPTALKVARVAQPLGIMGMAVEGTAKGAKDTMAAAKEIDAIQDENLQQQEYDNLIRNIVGYAKGGRAGFNSGSKLTLKSNYYPQIKEMLEHYKYYQSFPKSKSKKIPGYLPLKIFAREFYKENLASGGLAGIKSGPPPESGPNSQGLSGLLKRGIKIQE